MEKPNRDWIIDPDQYLERRLDEIKRLQQRRKFLHWALWLIALLLIGLPIYAVLIYLDSSL